ncbi:MAG: UDP-3-O-acyl-N-acetylglucosamine deacetylase [Pseudomonadota bacterium]
MRKTLAASVSFTGTGLHSGQRVTARLRPARGGGIVFVRTDVVPGTGTVPARYDLVSDTQLCSRLTNDHGVSVGTVEHLMAALAGAGVSDCRVELDGPEVPIMDGSAMPFMRRMAEVGLRSIGQPSRAIRILRPVSVEAEGKWAILMPAMQLSIGFHIDFADPAIGSQSLELTLSGRDVMRELADCRTFGHLTEVEQLRRAGLARGGSLENAIVVDQGRVLNPGGLRRRDEFVRHKMLDALGDLALAGAPILGAYVGEKAGHGLTNQLLRALFDQPKSWDWVPMPTEAALGLDPVDADAGGTMASALAG